MKAGRPRACTYQTSGAYATHSADPGRTGAALAEPRSGTGQFEESCLVRREAAPASHLLNADTA